MYSRVRGPLIYVRNKPTVQYGVDLSKKKGQKKEEAEKMDRKHLIGQVGRGENPMIGQRCAGEGLIIEMSQTMRCE